MSIFSQAILEAVTKTIGEPWGSGLNPLIIMGFTEAILDLGLDEKALHACVSSYARQLSSQVHPDRAGQTAPADRQREIIEAFEKLKEFGTFQQCLAAFKTSRAEDRREIGILRAALAAHRMRGDSAERAYSEVTAYRNRSEQELQSQRQTFLEEKQNTSEILNAQRMELEDYKARWRKRISDSFARRAQIIKQHEAEVDRAISILKRVKRPDTRWWRSRIGHG